MSSSSVGAEIYSIFIRMAALLPQMVVDYQSFVVGTEVVVAVAEFAAGSYFVDYNVDYNHVGFAVFVIVGFVDSLGFVAGTEVVVAVVELVVDNFDFALDYIVETAVVTVELAHYNLIVDFVDSLQVRKPTSYASAHIEYKLQRYT